MYVSVLHGRFTPDDGSVQSPEVSTLILFSSVQRSREELVRLAGMKSEGNVGGVANADPSIDVPFVLKEGYRLDNRSILMKTVDPATSG